MHPNYISDKPGECPICGMTLVPVEEEKTSEEGTMKISPEKQQLTGVTYGRVEYRNLKKVIRTVAKLSYDETNIRYITTKFSGWIEKLYVDYTGKLVKKGEPLFEIYSPELVSAQEEYLLALKFEKITERANSLLNSTRTRLLLWDISENQIKEIEESGKPMRRMVYYSPFSGFVIEKNVFEGKYISAGENLYKIADISNIWVFADIYEFELPFIKMGQEAIITLPYYPGEVFRGKITYIYPSLENETRTVKVRIELKNFEFKLKPEMFGNAEIDIDLGKKLAVPESAVIDTGMRKIVFVNRGNGYIEPREVKLGHRVDEYYEVLEGLSEGEEVVTSANFLIDSESNLKSAIKGMSGEHKHGQ
jgi:RND family efflux transporter MFP subunit